MRIVWGGAAAAVVGFVLFAAVLTGWALTAAGSSGASNCEGSAPSGGVPTELQPLFRDAAKAYALGAEGPAILAGLTKVESDFGHNMGPSSAGAVGWTQFMPATWRQFGVDADGDGRADPMTAADAIMSAARYLKHLGAPQDWQRALFGYNHAEWYVKQVLDQAGAYSGHTAGDLATLCREDLAVPAGAGGRLVGGGRIVPIPGQAGMRIDERIVGDLQFLAAKFHISVTSGYAASGHAAGGEHPLGLAVDIVPGAGGTWDDIDALARWAEPQPNHPRPPFRWVGYDGDSGHGRGDHLHLSWRHGPASGGAVAPWVQILIGAP